MGLFSFLNTSKNQNKKKILVYGSRGWIGSLFVQYLEEQAQFEVVHGAARVDRTLDVIHEIEYLKPRNVISFIGRTHGYIGEEHVNTIDYLEYPGKLVENIRDNLFAPLSLAGICKQRNIHYTYIGTGCIFNGTGFTEDSEPNFFGSSYSIIKGYTDRLMKDYNSLNLRIRMPISSVPNDRNFITKIISYERICSIPNSMTVLEDFFPIIYDLMKRKRTGTYNCTNPGTIDHDTILGFYTNYINSDFTWKNMELDEQRSILKSGRSNNELDTTKLEHEYIISDIKTSVQRTLVNYKKNLLLK